VLALIKDQPGDRRERESVGQNWRLLSPGFKRFLLPAGVFALAYYSLGFLLLKAHAVGFSLTDVVLLYALFNTTCVVAAPLVGKLGDRVGRRRIVMLGYATYGLLNLGAIWVDSRWEVTALFAVYGVFYAIEEQGLHRRPGARSPGDRDRAVQLRDRRALPARIADGGSPVDRGAGVGLHLVRRLVGAGHAGLRGGQSLKPRNCVRSTLSALGGFRK
jgi:hypothetical protein